MHKEPFPAWMARSSKAASFILNSIPKVTSSHPCKARKNLASGPTTPHLTTTTTIETIETIIANLTQATEVEAAMTIISTRAIDKVTKEIDVRGAGADPTLRETTKRAATIIDPLELHIKESHVETLLTKTLSAATTRILTRS